MGRWDQTCRSRFRRHNPSHLLVEHRVVRPAPAAEYLLHGFNIHTKKIGEGFEIWCERYDRANVKVTVGPTVEPLAEFPARTSCRPSNGKARIGSPSI